MYFLEKVFEFSASHILALKYDSKCKSLHGHNYKVTMTLCGETLNEEGMLIDFVHLKRAITDVFDHKNLNEVFYIKGWEGNPTAENIAKAIAELIQKLCIVTENKPRLLAVLLEESTGNQVRYDPDPTIESEEIKHGTDAAQAPGGKGEREPHLN